MDNERSGGVSPALAALLGLLALIIGLMSGLLLGGAGGFFLGRQLATTDTTGSAEQRAEDVASALGALADRGRGENDDESAPVSPHSLEELGQVPGHPGLPDTPGMPQIPGMPGVTIVGPDTAYLGVEVSSPGALLDGTESADADSDGDRSDGSRADGGTGNSTNETDTEGTDEGSTPQAGALVLSVQDGSAAAAAGLQTNDLIVAIDGERIETANDLATAIEERQVDDEVKLAFMRDGEQREVVVTLGRRPGVEPLDGVNPNLEELFDQMPPAMRERFREMMRPKLDDTGA